MSLIFMDLTLNSTMITTYATVTIGKVDIPYVVTYLNTFYIPPLYITQMIYQGLGVEEVNTSKGASFPEGLLESNMSLS